ncbi:MAG TPA: JAB domain-containing protein [Chitinophagaceae bacterium]|nr:JAB domain-containing protein [Chitinophagaceae bacterium]
MSEQNGIQSLFTITEVELIYRNPVKPSERKQVKTSQQAYDLLLASWDMNKIELLEEFKMLLLDRNNACIGISTIAKGGIHACVVDPKIVFATALKARACGLIFAHNHPSGSLVPSDEDLQLTQRFASAGQLLSINVLDHLIVTPHAYKSFADEGLHP